MKHVYLDCHSVHNYLEQEYGFKGVVYERSSGGNLFGAMAHIDLPDGTEVELDYKETLDYFGHSIEVTHYKAKGLKA